MTSSTCLSYDANNSSVLISDVILCSLLVLALVAELLHSLLGTYPLLENYSHSLLAACPLDEIIFECCCSLS
ncbi:hypothetical protein BT69DRAFT_1283515 [Atractiella rhizophila]|nr:hypothetical protein BT69DRAFT_1283515 [Atractiella rhizophila]